MPKHRKYTSEFKVQAVQLAIESGNISKTARDIGIGGTTLSKWVLAHKQTLADAGTTGLSPADAMRIKLLEKDNARLRQENEFLKKAAAFFAKSLVL